MSLHPNDFDIGAVNERQAFIQEIEELYQKTLALELFSSAIRAKTLSAKIRGFLGPPPKKTTWSSKPDNLSDPFERWNTETLNAFLEALERSHFHAPDSSSQPEMAPTRQS